MGKILKTINLVIDAIRPKQVTWALDKNGIGYEKIEDELDNNFETYLTEDAVKSLKKEQNVFESHLTDSGIPWMQTRNEIGNKSENNIQDTKNPKFTNEELKYVTKTNFETIQSIQKAIDLKSKIMKKTVNKSKENVLDIVKCSFTPEELAREKQADVEVRRRLKEIIESKFKVDKQILFRHFFDSKKGEKHYLDRYNKENAFKEWFDMTFPDYTIKEALELAITTTFSKPQSNPSDIFDPKKDLRNYIDIYNNDSMYKEWFDMKYPGQSIYEVVGIPEFEQT